jgi:hypothetical protein
LRSAPWRRDIFAGLVEFLRGAMSEFYYPPGSDGHFTGYFAMVR